MKDFPLNELLAATDLDKIQDSLNQIFIHINKKLKISCVVCCSLPWPASRDARTDLTRSDAPFRSSKPSLATSTTSSFASSALND